MTEDEFLKKFQFIHFEQEQKEELPSHDRVVTQCIEGHWHILFQKCEHSMKLPWVKAEELKKMPTRELDKWLRELNCPGCEDEFREMEKHLNNEIKRIR